MKFALAVIGATLLFSSEAQHPPIQILNKTIPQKTSRLVPLRMRSIVMQAWIVLRTRKKWWSVPVAMMT